MKVTICLKGLGLDTIRNVIDIMFTENVLKLKDIVGNEFCYKLGTIDYFNIITEYQ